MKIVEIKVFNNKHICNRVSSLHHPQAAAALISSTIQGRVQDHPKYYLVKVVHDAHREQGIKISYLTA